MNNPKVIEQARRESTLLLLETWAKMINEINAGRSGLSPGDGQELKQNLLRAFNSFYDADLSIVSS